MKATLDSIVEFALGYCPPYPQRVDWYDLVYRIEVRFDIDLPDNLRNPEIREIIREVNRVRREAHPAKGWTKKRRMQ